MPMTSSVAAVRVPMDSPVLVRCAQVRLVVKPRAPARMPASHRRLMASMSSAEARSVWSAPRVPMT